MLRFQSKPDEVFIDIIDAAIEQAIGWIDLEDAPSEQEESFSEEMPRSSRVFTWQEAKTQLVALKRANRAKELLKPTDYHWLLLYEALNSYCNVFNDDPHGSAVDRYGIESIDFDDLVEYFFWDTDFLDDTIGNLPLEARDAMDVSPETFGLALGMKPHPEELVLREYDVSDVDEETSILFTPGSKHYPSPPDPGETRDWPEVCPVPLRIGLNMARQFSRLQSRSRKNV